MTTCNNCLAPYSPLRGGLCVNCYRYVRRTGESRPYRGDGRGLANKRGADSPQWKGDAARPETKRARAQRAYALGPCVECGAPGTDRHHRDGDTGNNTPDNVKILCRRCHMTEDGRLDAFLSTCRGRHYATVGPDAPRPCANCGRPARPLRRGLCHACNEYQRRRGKPRPYVNDGRTERAETTEHR